MTTRPFGFLAPFPARIALTAMIAFLAPGLGAQAEPAVTALTVGEREKSEILAERIAESLYRIDYLDPSIPSSEIDSTIMTMLAEAQPSPVMRRYIGEILGIWFASNAPVIEMVGRLLPEYPARIDLAQQDSKSDATGAISSAASRKKNRRIRRIAPLKVVARGSSDY